MTKHKARSDALFFLVSGGLSSCFVALIVLLLAADASLLSKQAFLDALAKPEIQSSIRLTLLSCTVSAILAVWVAVPFGYLLARYKFPGSPIVEFLVDIPIILPPLVIGLSLLVLFHIRIGDMRVEEWFNQLLGLQITYHWPAVVLAQFSVAGAFAIRTMRVAFDQIDARPETIARTLGCSRGQAFVSIALPQAWRAVLSATTIAWARSMGEFGPILVFAGSTRMRTEVLSTSVFLELSVGNLQSAVAVSMLMVGVAAIVLLILRFVGPTERGQA